MRKIYTIAEALAALDGVHVLECPICGAKLRAYHDSREPCADETPTSTVNIWCPECYLWREEITLPVEAMWGIIRETYKPLEIV